MAGAQSRVSERPDAARQINSLPFAVLLIGPDLRIAGANPAAEQLLDQSARRIMGRLVETVIRFSEPLLSERLTDADAHISAHDVTVQIGNTHTGRVNVMLAPVIESPGWQMLALVRPGGVEALGGNVGAHDGGVLRAPEILAHEIKNPLAGIRGAAQLLGRRLRGADRSLTELIADEVDRIAKLIDQMQPLSRRTPEPAEPCNPHEALRRARSVLEAARPDVVFIEEYDPSLPPVMASADSLLQVLLNLMTNACEACGGQERPEVRLRTRFASGIQLHPQTGGAPIPLPIEIRVSDNGPGIDPALRDHIFEPFVSGRRHGQGLGLALVRKLVRDMHGRITCDREEAAGLTHFRIHLPVAPVSRSAPKRAVAR